MTKHRYVIGLDYGSLSCRGVLADCADGRIAASAEYVYAHGILTETLPDGTRLPAGFILQHPQDYTDALETILPVLTADAAPEEIAAIAIDSTVSTVIPVDKDFKPLALSSAFSSEPHAWPKMWKHGAVSEAQLLEDALRGSRPELLKACGGTVSPSAYLPKVMETAFKAPQCFAAAETFFELGDWITSLLAGREIRSKAMLKAKAFWREKKGYASDQLFAAHPVLSALPGKLAERPGSSAFIAYPGENAGCVSPEMAEHFGLSANTVITGAQMDGYAGLPGSGITGPGELLAMFGTSATYLLLSEDYQTVPAISASLEGSILPGLTAHAAGDGSVGDSLRFVTENFVPERYAAEAAAAGKDLHSWLTALASPLKPGGTGLLVLNWLRGSKALPIDSDLSGLIIGLTPQTKPEQIYRAFLESIAFRSREIAAHFEACGMSSAGITVCGGVARKNPLFLQILADVLGKPVSLSPTAEAAALGSAIYAAAAAEGSVTGAIRRMAPLPAKVFKPDADAHAVYDRLYRQYLRLSCYFSEENRVMAELKELKKD